MLITRLITGAALIALTAGMLLFDKPPWYPFLAAFVFVLSMLACRELVSLLGPYRQPQVFLCYLGVLWMGASNWLAHQKVFLEIQFQPWQFILFCYVLVVLAAFLQEMTTYEQSGRSLERIALTQWIVAYLGLLPCFLAQLRWFYASESAFEVYFSLERSTAALALLIFTAKGCDIGAYTIGRLIGRFKMTPVLSPKKTWEGAVGGLVLACAIAVVLDRWVSVDVAPLKQSWLYEIGFGLAIGISSMFGDLAESLIKRDCEQKDASHVVPGFGGVLDVIDSLLFAAPVAYVFFMIVEWRASMPTAP
ncbi:MAG: phosphatidate cytidylyltransferase [Gemmataceae bacterium]|nr:phosphatidate cytidylyltransferase [Gemmataceae bacterium]MCI0741928.1 phosphatidate cytidylyltransferase [Gemmataceae bacterium]